MESHLQVEGIGTESHVQAEVQAGVPPLGGRYEQTMRPWYSGCSTMRMTDRLKPGLHTAVTPYGEAVPVSRPRYLWRRLTAQQREEVLAWRKANSRPWHAPLHRPNCGHVDFHITAACYEHVPHIGFSPTRVESFSNALLDVFQRHATRTVAWCVLPNHYHALVEALDISKLLYQLGRFHGRTSYEWNGEEATRGRQVFHGATERYMRSDRHFFATINYIHNNPVHHGYVRQWADWPWGNAADYLEQMGLEEAQHVWKEYPIRDYGRGWDDGDL